jgi:AAHS family 4-hydroxybenzoate transporter-like MFS transporter
LYPTDVRATGVGWAQGIGRVGSILGPAIGGMLMTAHVSMRDLFLLSAMPAVAAAIAVAILGLLLARRTASHGR